MFIQQADLLRGMERDFIKSFLDIAIKEYPEAGAYLSHNGDWSGGMLPFFWVGSSRGGRSNLTCSLYVKNIHFCELFDLLLLSAV